MIWILLGVIAACLMALPAQTPTQPGIRFGHSLVYDSDARRVVLVDGYTWVRRIADRAAGAHRPVGLGWT